MNWNQGEGCAAVFPGAPHCAESGVIMPVGLPSLVHPSLSPSHHVHGPAAISPINSIVSPTQLLPPRRGWLGSRGTVCDRFCFPASLGVSFVTGPFSPAILTHQRTSLVALTLWLPPSSTLVVQCQGGQDFLNSFLTLYSSPCPVLWPRLCPLLRSPRIHPATESGERMD